MKAFTALCMLTMLVLYVEAQWSENHQCFEVKKKKRGYRSGFADPKELLKSDRFWTGAELLRGSIESRDDLPPIEQYELTAFTYKQRQRYEMKMYKVDDCSTWDDFFMNITELTREHYDFYIVDPDNGDYIFKN